MLFKELTFLGGYWTNNDRNTDKGEVGGSNPPRPTIQITSKYAAILTFPLSGKDPSGEGRTAASIRLCRECRPVRSKDVHGCARNCKVEGAGRHFWAVFEGVVQLDRTPAS